MLHRPEVDTLHLAAYRGDREAIEILLHNGANAMIKTKIDNFCDAEQTARMAGNREAADLIRDYFIGM